jgi:hypothetical protein
VAITTVEARGQILDELAGATIQISFAVSCLGAAYEVLDEVTADRLESELFRPAQRALARAKRAGSGFAGRYGLIATSREAPSPGLPSQGVKVFVERAITASLEASRRIAELQDSMLPIEAGDPELRSALAETRELVDGLAGPARQFLSTLGR